jgi:hypothetical protein
MAYERMRTMKKTNYFLILLGILLILFSTPLAYSSIDFIYRNRNLSSEYLVLLDGFIAAYRWVGIIISSGAIVHGVFASKKL